MAESAGKKSDSLSFIFDLLKPETEKFIEHNLDHLLEVPVIRELFNVSPRVMVALLSGLIGKIIPEESRSHPLLRFIGDVAESLPREIGRVLEADDDGTRVADTRDPAATAKHMIRAKKRSGRTVAATSPEGILRLLDKKFSDVPGGVMHFIRWFLALPPTEQKKVEANILSFRSDRLKIFIGFSPEERMEIVRNLPDPTANNEPDSRFSSVFIERLTQHMQERPEKKQRYYNLITRFLYAISGNPIDSRGRRSR